MGKRRWTLLFLVLAAALAGASCTGRVGREAPAFNLPGMRGGTLGLAELKGQPALIGFFATWAPPSRMAVPEMAQLVAKYKTRGLAVVGIAVQEERARVKRFLSEVPANFPVLLCDEPTEKAWFGNGEVKVPVFVILDGEGVVREWLVGYHSARDLEPFIERVLPEANNRKGGG